MAMETELPDLQGLTLDQLSRPEIRDQLEPFRQVLLGQVERPRPNIGTGPPGRAD